MTGTQRDDVTNDVFEKYDFLSVHNDNGAFFFLRKVKQVALMIRPNHIPNVRAVFLMRSELITQCAAPALNRKLNGRPSQWHDCLSTGHSDRCVSELAAVTS